MEAVAYLLEQRRRSSKVILQTEEGKKVSMGTIHYEFAVHTVIHPLAHINRE